MKVGKEELAAESIRRFFIFLPRWLVSNISQRLRDTPGRLNIGLSISLDLSFLHAYASPALVWYANFTPTPPFCPVASRYAGAHEAYLRFTATGRIK